MATNALRKTANALSSEPELLNVHADLKEISRAFEAYVKAIEQSDKTLMYWAERKGEDAGVREFMAKIVEVDAEVATIDRKFNDHFRIFVKLWKGILAEKKDLNTKLAALKKARANTDAMRKKVYKAEEKEPRDQEKYARAKQAQADAEAEEAEMMKVVGQKLLEVQQDQHETLRTGYSGLFEATSSRLRELAVATDKIRILVNNLPKCSARRDDGTFVTEPFAGPFVAPPVWCQGEQLQRELALVRSGHEEEMRRLTEKHAQSMRSVAREREVATAQSSEAYSNELRTVHAQHATMIAQMQEAHERALGASEQQRHSVMEAHKAALAELENKLALTAAELASRQHDVLAHEADEARLEEEIEKLKEDVRGRAVRRAEELTVRASRAAGLSCIDHSFESLAALRVAASDLQQLDPKAVVEVYDAKVADFSAAVACAILSIVGALRGSPAENALPLLDVLDELPEAAVAALRFRAGTKRREISTSSDNDSDEEETVKSTSLPQCVALYDHDAKVQQGFNLVGFRKGELMQVIKKREDGWSKVCKDGQEGWAPTSYLRDLSTSSSPPPEQDEGEDKSPGLSAPSCWATLSATIDKLHRGLEQVQQAERALRAQTVVMEETVAAKVSAAQQSILDAQGHIAKLKAQAAESDKGRLLETGQAAAAKAAEMLGFMLQLINAASDMRSDLEGPSHTPLGSQHAPWLAALASASDAVAAGCPLLTEAFRCVLGRKGRHEELQVAARNIAASVAQLTALSRTKTGLPRESTAQARIAAGSDAVIGASHEVLAAARERQDVELAGTLIEDLGALSENEAKRLIMATQVQVLRLERELEGEREKLGRLRRLTYDDGNRGKGSSA